MRVAIITDGNKVSQQFGKNITFTVFEVIEGKTRGKMVVNVSASGEGDSLLYVLDNEGVEVLLCGEIREELRRNLEDDDIKVVSGLKGNVNAILRAYLRAKKMREAKHRKHKK